MTDDVVILDAARPETGLCPPARWQAITDQVMGGVSRGAVALEDVAGQPALVLSGAVSLDNNGGFIQMACDLMDDGGPFDASGLAALRLRVRGDGVDYGLHLRTTDLARPWQSYRLAFRAPTDWTDVMLPLADAEPHRTDAPFRPDRLRRLGLVAIGRAFRPWLAVAGIVGITANS
jgi:hypothetical protein